MDLGETVGKFLFSATFPNRRTSGSPARRSALTGDMIVRLSTGSTGGVFGGIGVGIEIPEVGEGPEIGDEKVA